ncbi:MAG: hypothetical protein ACI379_03005 [Nocardioides sp.]|uniref:hypothetical protein n=1 Tax=Nocardioides sp. TaxID=35761 RepID=UPI003EFDED37
MDLATWTVRRVDVTSNDAGRTGFHSPTLIGPDGWVAQVDDVNGRSSNRARVMVSGELDPTARRGSFGWTPVPKTGQTWGVLAWREGRIVVATRSTLATQGRLRVVDPLTGASSDLVASPESVDGEEADGNSLPNWAFARDLLETAPTRPGIEPPSPLDPRLVAGGVAGALVLGAYVLWRLRRV